MRSKGNIVCIIACFLPFFASGQVSKALVSGQIRSEGLAIPNVNIGLKNTPLGTFSDTSGKYEIRGIAPGTYILIFTHLNYEKDSVEITLQPGQSLIVDNELKSSISSLDEVEIKGKTTSQELREKPFQVSVIDVLPLQQRNLDVNKILTQTSGVRVRQTAGLGSSFDLTLNGLQASQFINGIPIDIYGPAYSLNSIPINQIERIEIFKGIVPVHLGSDALGGAVNIITKNKLTNNLNAAYSIGSFNTHRASVRGTHSSPTTGFTSITSAFYNSSDNDYIMKDMEILSQNVTYKKDVRRFHDDYQSFAARTEMGVVNKQYADVMLAGVGFSTVKKNVQTGSYQYPPIGAATGKDDNYQLSLRYTKYSLLQNKLDLSAFLLFNNTHTVFVDTSSWRYQWDGTIADLPPSSKSGEFGEKEIFKMEQRDIAQRYNIAYHLTDQQTLTLNLMTTNTRRGNTDSGKTEGTSVRDNIGRYSKFIIGLGHDMKIWNDKFQTTSFVKYYQLNADIDSALSSRGGYFVKEPLHTSKSFWGAGTGLAYAISEKISFKVSAEYACRLPHIYEILGDGISTVSNVSLKPELSMNYNLGISLIMIDHEKLTLSFNVGSFYRKAENFIRPTPGVNRSTFINFNKALVRGIESEVNLSIVKKLSLRLNATYQQVLDDKKFTGGSIKNYSYHIQLPNTPYLFGNVNVEYKVTGFLKKFNIVPYYSLLYVNEYYLGYANIARGDKKYTIPLQLVHDIGVTLSDRSERYAVSIDSSNFTNSLAYDNFKLQKPGRAFNLKLTYNIH